MQISTVRKKYFVTQPTAACLQDHDPMSLEGGVYCPFYKCGSTPQQSGIAPQKQLSRHRHDIPRKSSQEHYPHSNDLLLTIQQFLRIWRSLSLPDLLDSLRDSPDLVKLSIITRLS
jgi:hypothetical protein